MIVDFNRRILGNSFLSEVVLSEAESERQLDEIEPACVGRCIELCAAHGAPIVVADSEHAGGGRTRATLSIPVFYGSSLRSIVSFVIDPAGSATASDTSNRTGVFEVWTPQGVYQDLGLTSGFFGRLERFHNVSSFVRFEKGSGLPGQAWSLGRTVIHDNLKVHPGFLRAAGASADSLQTAVGIPVFASDYVSTVVLISGLASPIAQAFEVWQPTAFGFELTDRAYNGFAQSCQLPLGASTIGRGLLGAVSESKSAVLTDDVATLWTDRRLDVDNAAPLRAVAIPTYSSGHKLSCITVMVL